MNQNYHLKILLSLLAFLSTRLISFACSCNDSLTVSQDYKNSDVVMLARIIDIDTVYSGNTLVYDRKEVRFGRNKFSVATYEYLRVKMIVEKKFKSPTALPDTVYILTSTESSACGYPFPTFKNNGSIPSSYFEFIIYGDKWIEKKIVASNKGKKESREMKETLLTDTFFTSRCRRTQHANETELNKLSELIN